MLKGNAVCEMKYPKQENAFLLFAAQTLFVFVQRFVCRRDAGAV
jgi:hypothetical protein